MRNKTFSALFLVILFSITFVSALNVTVQYPHRVLYLSNQNASALFTFNCSGNVFVNVSMNNASINSSNVSVSNVSVSNVSNSNASNNGDLNGSFGLNGFCAMNLTAYILNKNYTIENGSIVRFSLDTSNIGNNSFLITVKENSSLFFNKSYFYNVTADWDRDGYNSTVFGGVDCDDNNPLINPERNEIKNNGVDDDCNSSTDDIDESVTLNKAEYKTGETIRITVNSRQDDNFTITVISNETNNVVYSTPVKGPFPKIIYVNSIKRFGNYSVNINKGGFLVNKADFIVKNPLEVSFSYSIEKPMINQECGFDTNVNGGYPIYAYKWDFGDGSSSNEKYPKHKFTSAKEYEVSLEITDKEGNKKTVKKIIEVFNSLNIDIKAVDSETKKGIYSAEVYLGEQHGTTNRAGSVRFTVPRSDYVVQILNNRYETFSKTIDVTDSAVFTFTLNKTFYDDVSPQISIINPSNGGVIAKHNAEIKYKVIDATPKTCTLYFGQDNKNLKENAHADVQNNTNESFTIKSVEDGKHYWKIACIDDYENTGETRVLNFVVNTSEEFKFRDKYYYLNDELRANITKLKTDIDKILSKIPAKSSNDKTVASAIKWDKLLNSQKETLSRISRDIFNLRYRKINSTERYKIALNLTQNYQKVRSEIISDIKSDAVKSVVYYPDEATIKGLSDVFLNALGYNDSHININSFADDLKKLQGELTVTSTFGNFKISYYNGNNKDYTLVRRMLNFNQSMNVSILEYLPKNITNSTGDIMFLDENYKILQEDPLIKYPKDANEIVYLINGYKDIEKLQKTYTFLVSRKIVLKEYPKIAGFSIFHFKAGKDGGAFYVLLFVILLLMLYFLSSLGFVKNLFGKNVPLHKISSLIAEANDSINKNNLDNATLVFKEIELFFRKLPDGVKENVYPEIYELADKINVEKIDTMFNNAVYLIENMKKDESVEIYNKIVNYYNQLSDKSKKEVFDRLNNLKQSLDGN